VPHQPERDWMFFRRHLEARLLQRLISIAYKVVVVQQVHQDSTAISVRHHAAGYTVLFLARPALLSSGLYRPYVLLYLLLIYFLLFLLKQIISECTASVFILFQNCYRCVV